MDRARSCRRSRGPATAFAEASRLVYHGLALQGDSMTAPAWKVSGQYYETCSCDYVCPCILGQMAVPPTQGTCTFAMAFQIERGEYGTVSLDGLGFIVLGFTPEAMGKGNWSVGVIADERASAEQREAITAIASGSAGGPMAGV